MVKKLLQYILWQSTKKPSKNSEYFVTILYWLLVVFYEILIFIGLQKLNINIYLKYVLTLWFALNSLFAGSTWENTSVIAPKLWFFGIFYAIKNTNKENF